jgi:hypothetical protein
MPGRAEIEDTQPSVAKSDGIVIEHNNSCVIRAAMSLYVGHRHYHGSIREPDYA